MGNILKYSDFVVKLWCLDVIEPWKHYIINNVKHNGIIVIIGVHG